MELTNEQRQGLNAALSEATCLGIGIDEPGATFRVDLEVLTLPADGNRRVSVVLSGVSRIAASLRTFVWTHEKPDVERLTLAQLPGAVHSFGAAPLHGWEFIDLPDSGWSRWSELLSLDAHKHIDDAVPHVLEISLEEGPASPRELDIRVWFRALHVQDSNGRPLPLERFIDGGRRWWHAHNTGELPAISLDVAPRL